MTAPRASAATPATLDIAAVLNDARRHLHENNLALPDLLAQDVLASDPENADALTILGEVAIRRGLRNHAISFLTRARVRAPAESVAGVLLQQAVDLAPEEAFTPNERILVIKAWGMGLWSDVTHVLGGLLLAELTGRTPVTLWGKNSLYSDGAVLDAFKYYFEPISPHGPDDVLRVADRSIFPPKWNLKNILDNNIQKFHGSDARLPASSFLNRREPVIVTDWAFGVPDLIEWIPEGHEFHRAKVSDVLRKLIQKYIRPSAAVRARLSVLDDLHDLSTIEIAVHARGTDKAREVGNLDELNAFYLQAIESIYEGGRILLLTDDDRLIPRFLDRFGDRIVVPVCERQLGDTAVHLRGDLDRKSIGFESVRDVYAAARASKFIGNGRSNFSGIIPLLMKSTRNAYLIGRNVVFERDATKYLLPLRGLN